MKRTRRCMLQIVVFFVVLATILRTFFTLDKKMLSGGERRDFIYLIQAKSCLPEYFLSTNIVKRDVCHCDIVVFGYKERCSTYGYVGDSGSVEYIHKANTTWNGGRNALYRSGFLLTRNQQFLLTSNTRNAETLRSTGISQPKPL